MRRRVPWELQPQRRCIAACLGETITSTFILLFIASCLKKLSLCFPCFLGTRSPNDEYLYYFSCVMPLAFGKYFVHRLQVLYVFGVMGLDLRDHNCYLLKKGNQQRVISEFERKQGCKWRCMMLLCISSQLVSVAVLASCWARPWADNPRWRAAERSRDRRTYRQQLQSLCKLQKSIDVVAVLPLRFCWSLCLLLRGSLPLAMMTLVRFDAWPHLAYLSIISAPSLEIVDSISSCWSVLNIFDTFLILYAFWVRGHDGFYICNLCTLTWIWQCFCINAPHWLVFVRSGGIQILLSVWAASVVCRALWKILKVVSGITSSIAVAQLHAQYVTAKRDTWCIGITSWHSRRLWYRQRH